jgi:arylsulfatase A-like enzyme
MKQQRPNSLVVGYPMKAIMIMFDSLNRHMLPPYGCEWVHAPNFERLAGRTVAFENCYIGSMPCMPARRELHTGRYNLLHRSWGPLEPFDDSMPEILRRQGVYTHLITDHVHYWEDGGASYHTRYESYELVRGQEADQWKGQVDLPPDLPPRVRIQSPDQPERMWAQDWINRSYMPTPEDQPQAKTFQLGLEFIRSNHQADRWFLQIETFDPHEPFFTHREYQDLYPHRYKGPVLDWPSYGPVVESPEQVEHLRLGYVALVSMCDAQLGKVLDLMDELDMWRDTMLIVCTDHGFLLGEHDWWAKNVQPWYNENAHTPLFIYDPRCAIAGERRQSLVQMIDLPATLLEYFGLPLPADMQGLPLRDTVARDTPVRRAALFGVHGGHVNVTDGRYVYMRAPAHAENKPLYEYTLMPTHIRSRFSVEELATARLVPPFSFTKGVPLLQVEARPWIKPHPFGTLLFDLETDPRQERPLQDAAIEAMMIHHLIRLMLDNDSPPEQFERLGLTAEVERFRRAGET